MLTDGSIGFRYGYTVTDLNRTVPNSDAYSRLSDEAMSTGLLDGQTVQSSDSSNPNKKHEGSRYNSDGTLKADEAKKMKKADGTRVSVDEYYKNLLKPEKDENTVPGSKVSAEKSEHAKGKHDGFDEDCPLCECETCRNRRYKDDSDDSGVSFQQATKMNPAQARYKVKSHEMEHVRREQYEAKEKGHKVIAQSVQIMTDVCPECGETYVSGGLTRTATRTVSPEFIDLFRVGAEDITRKGETMDQIA